MSEEQPRKKKKVVKKKKVLKKVVKRTAEDGAAPVRKKKVVKKVVKKKPAAAPVAEVNETEAIEEEAPVTSSRTKRSKSGGRSSRGGSSRRGKRGAEAVETRDDATTEKTVIYGLLIGLIPGIGIIGAVAAFMGKARIKASNGHLKGEGLAVVAILVSLVWGTLSGLWVFIVLMTVMMGNAPHPVFYAMIPSAIAEKPLSTEDKQRMWALEAKQAQKIASALFAWAEANPTAAKNPAASYQIAKVSSNDPYAHLPATKNNDLGLLQLPPLDGGDGGLPPVDSGGGGLPPVDSGNGGLPPVDNGNSGLPPVNPEEEEAPADDPLPTPDITTPAEPKKETGKILPASIDILIEAGILTEEDLLSPVLVGIDKAASKSGPDGSASSADIYRHGDFIFTYRGLGDIDMMDTNIIAISVRSDATSNLRPTIIFSPDIEDAYQCSTWEEFVKFVEGENETRESKGLTPIDPVALGIAPKDVIDAAKKAIAE